MPSDTPLLEKPLSHISDSLRESFEFVKVRAVRFILLQLFGFIPIAVLGALIGLGALVMSLEGRNLDSIADSRAVVAVLTILLAAGIVVAIYFAVWSKVAQLWYAAQSADSESIRDILVRTRVFVLGYLGVSLGYSLIVIGGTLLLIVPGIIWYWKYFFAPYVYFFERDEQKSFSEVLRRSAALSAGYRWGIFTRILALLCVIAGAQILVQSVSSMVIGLGETTRVGFVVVIVTGLVYVGSAIVNMIVQALSMVFQYRVFAEVWNIKRSAADQHPVHPFSRGKKIAVFVAFGIAVLILTSIALSLVSLASRFGELKQKTQPPAGISSTIQSDVDPIESHDRSFELQSDTNETPFETLIPTETPSEADVPVE